ncbi:MAG: threonine aldolase [Bacteroidetes bacterium]|nr:threonine aldolase [Bacteroidota bacterium]
MNQIIDLRSDTVTKPTKGMLDAMFSAKVGDDVFGDDPTVNELQQKAADMFGMEAALFCPSGTMTNQIAIKVHTKPGDEVICEQGSHVYRYEGGGIGFNAGSSIRLIQGDRGRIKAQQVTENFNNPDDPHLPLTRLVVAENTANRGGGSCYQLTDLEAISKVCEEKGLGFHLDGARLFNALVTTGITPKQIGTIFDSVSICLSKGLGAPVGSLLLGSKDFIKQGLRVRKVFGGGMRQAGYLAAAGIYALDHHIERLAEDHKRAMLIGQTLESCSFVKEVLPIETNIVIFTLQDDVMDADFLNKLKEHNIWAVGFGPQMIRMVTHLDFSDEMLDQLIELIH